MERIIGIRAGLGVVHGGMDAVQRGTQPLQIGQGGPRAGQANGLALDGDARLHRVVEQLGTLRQGEGKEVTNSRNVGAAHHGAHAVTDLHNTDHGKRPQCLAKHRSGNTKLQRQLALGGEPVAGTDGAGEKLVTEKAQHTIETAAGRFLRADFFVVVHIGDATVV